MIKHHHFIIYKPFGYLSQFVSNQNKQRNKKMLGDLYDFPEGAMAIGRLDESSEGLLLVTTDGKVSEQVRSKEIEKEYYAQLDGEITDEAVEQLKTGIEIGTGSNAYTTLPCKAFRLDLPPDFPPRAKKIRDERHGPTSWLSITLTEGKFRQVRKMTAAVGFPTLRLVRVRIGAITLDRLEPGQAMEVDGFEMDAV
ncbi:pseudouridine synthase [Fulvivirga kasyanovii]|uniref:Pseudouridine synthase n=1 Tax=Fulvivirga kasyanovii TaxID=396812 RepID=A0ABW9RI21_9BACT|nr:pseudouridine synthase [Fulvivirga kasyanovii]MTI23547.1 pseudouridine synthase [Fulvivirga kasyanovii]